jgi:hypothetical protein
LFNFTELKPQIPTCETLEALNSLTDLFNTAVLTGKIAGDLLDRIPAIRDEIKQRAHQLHAQLVTEAGRQLDNVLRSSDDLIVATNRIRNDSRRSSTSPPSR